MSVMYGIGTVYVCGCPTGHKKPTEAQIQLVELVRFFLEVNIHQHATYFVDSLWDYTSVIRVSSCQSVSALLITL